MLVTQMKCIDGPLQGQVRDVYGHNELGVEINFPPDSPEDGILLGHIYRIGEDVKTLVYSRNVLAVGNCCNLCCNKILEIEDFPRVISSQRMSFGKDHLCQECFARFDGQKMRGRSRSMGMNHNQLVGLAAKMDQEVDGGCPFNVGHPSDEGRYTEIMSEWLGWQRAEMMKFHNGG